MTLQERYAALERELLHINATVERAQAALQNGLTQQSQTHGKLILLEQMMEEEKAAPPAPAPLPENVTPFPATVPDKVD